MPTLRRRRIVAGLAAGLAGLASAVVVAVLPAAAAPGDGSPSDTNLAFVGRWDTRNASGYVPNWQGSYLKTGFTGTTVKLRQRNAVDLYYSIDGAAFRYLTNVSGTVNLTPTPLSRGNHTLLVSYRNVDGSYRGDAVFQGLILDPGASTVPARVSPTTLEFVGDSITRGSTSSMVTLTSYGWLTGERLGAEHVQLGYGGGCLVAAADGCASVGDRYTKTGASASSPEWDFRRYTADAVVINLGTNDRSHGVPGPDFQARYVALIRTIRGKYPRAAIFALRTFSGRYATETANTVGIVNRAGDTNVHYVDTTGWLPANGLSDSVHPNDVGHAAIAARLAPIVKARLATTTPPVSVPPSASPSAVPSASPSVVPSASPSVVPSASAACSVGYTLTSQWQGGFQADVTVRNNGTGAINPWALEWPQPSGQGISQAWNATVTVSGGTVRVTGTGWNGSIPPGGTASFGFIGTTSGSPARPAGFTLNGTTCTTA